MVKPSFRSRLRLAEAWAIWVISCVLHQLVVDAGIDDAGAGHVERYPRPRRDAAGFKIPAHPLQHGQVEFAFQAAQLDHREDAGRHDQAMFATNPYQRLVVFDLRGWQRQHRLIVHLQPIGVGHRLVNSTGFGVGDQRFLSFAHLRRIDRDLALPRSLGVIHGQIGLAVQQFERVVVGVIQMRDAHADADRLLDAIGRKVVLQHPLDTAFRHLPGALDIRCIQHRGKFVSTQPVKMIARSQRTEQRLRQPLQYLVADLMAVGVVDGLEVVAIEQQKCHAHTGSILRTASGAPVVVEGAPI